MAGQNPSNVLFIGDLSIFCTEKDLTDLFAGYGNVTEVKIMKSDDKGRSLSYGFVKFSDIAEASYAMNHLQHKLLHGRHLRINYASHRNRVGTQFACHSDGLETSPVHVSFISYQTLNLVTEASLRQLFSKYGPVADVSIKKSTVDRALNRQSGYGFVHYPITFDGINAAFLAATELQDTTVDEVNYKSSLSHKLAEHIEQAKVSRVPTNQQTQDGTNYAYRNPNEIKQPTLMPHQVVSAPPPRQYSYVPLSVPATGPSLPSPPTQHHAIPTYHQISSFATALPVQPPPQLRSTIDQAIVVSPVMVPHYITTSPQVDYSRFPYDTHVHYTSNIPINGFTLFHNTLVNSPPQATHSPQTYYALGDNRFGCTPSSISSVDTMFDQIVGPLLVSPSDYAYGNMKSPSNAASNQPLQQHVSRHLPSAPKNQPVNLKKLRQKPMRKTLNQLEVSHPSTEGREQKNRAHSEEHEQQNFMNSEKSEIDGNS